MMPLQWRGSSPDELRYGDPIGPPATINREPGQAWKGAAAAVTLCAGVWLVGLPPIMPVGTLYSPPSSNTRPRIPPQPVFLRSRFSCLRACESNRVVRAPPDVFIRG
ncbi:protein of unknown function [Pseudomonas sp. JV241A]|nr:protein of unknown function [Pseudomonas sp. JV241A]